eukprot:6125231-Pyramimonas_sp.AAC.1
MFPTARTRGGAPHQGVGNFAQSGRSVLMCRPTRPRFKLSGLLLRGFYFGAALRKSRVSLGAYSQR